MTHLEELMEIFTSETNKDPILTINYSKMTITSPDFVTWLAEKYYPFSTYDIPIEFKSCNTCYNPEKMPCISCMDKSNWQPKYII
ncbi:hypothetical protein M0P65_06130 [Candidatus Gracilibacteria bacterium]|jgi:hypothetical protein|nr:hypothetical protein [Candidatus Gracilibacteria bacterium]